MSAISNLGTTTTTTFGRNSSYPTCETLSFHSHNQSGVYNGRRCSSTTILPSANEQSLKGNPVNYRTLDRQTHLNLTENLSWLERCKQRLTNLLKQISKSNTAKQDSITMINTLQQQSSIFNYDPELDLREEHLSLVAKRLLTTLRESKIKHLSCDNLFIPCNHI
ncbi:unnamed protein product, partial [Adineta ricciae]